MNEWIDGHLDLAYLGLSGRDVRIACADPSAGCISLPELRQGGVSLFFGTIFTEPGKPGEPCGYRDSDDADGAHEAGLRQIEFYEGLERAGNIAIVRSRADLDRSTDALKAVILMEGADPIRAPEEAGMWFARGVRIVGLTWAMGSRYAGGNVKTGPLAPMGRELIAALDEFGIAHDLSHLSDPAALDLLSLSKGRVIASHSNARAMMAGEPKNAIPGVSAGLERHLPDAFIREVAARGGAVGVNLYSKFLIERARIEQGQRAAIEDCLNHIEHIADVMGHRRGIALGSDADGGFPPTMLPEELDHPTKWSALCEGLRERGWSDEEVNGFAHDNWLSFLRHALPEI